MFHCYTVSTDHRARDQEGRYVVSAEYSDGYEIIFRSDKRQDACEFLDRVNKLLPNGLHD